MPDSPNGYPYPDVEETFTHHLSDPVPVTILRVDLMVLAGLVDRLLGKEDADLAKLRAHPPETYNEPLIEKIAWRTAHRRRLFEQLRLACGPMYDAEHARKKHAERMASGKWADGLINPDLAPLPNAQSDG